jgi:cytochrome c oxidase assembly protein subunit 15
MPGAGGSARAFAWQRALALATLVSAIPLIFFGGTVTTLHAGLAIDGWFVLEPGRGDWFLWAYPIEQWFRDVGTFVEHTHRLLGSAVGLLAIATVVATLAADRRAAACKLALAALSCVIAQGVLGGLRVLEKSEGLAFVHGAFGQLTFAFLCATFAATRASWIASSPAPRATAMRLRRLAAFAAAAVYGEIVVGAWLRHGGGMPALFVHISLVIAVVLAVLLLSRELGVSAPSVESPSTFRSLRRALLIALGAQITLGVLAFVSLYLVVGKNPASIPQSMLPTLHVMGGAALFATSFIAWLWSRRSPRALAAALERRSSNAPVAERTLARAELGGST